MLGFFFVVVVVSKGLLYGNLFITFEEAVLSRKTGKSAGFPGGTSGGTTCQCRRHKRCGFDPWVRKMPLEEGMATHASILAWRVPWAEEPGRLQSMRSQKNRTQLRD